MTRQTLTAMLFAACLSVIRWTPSAVARDASGRTVFLDQGWSPADRESYYTTSQGSALLSYDIFRTLENAKKPGLFRSDENLASYGFTLQPAEPQHNPDALPVGWTKTVIAEGRWKGEWAGISCAACHNAQLVYQGTRIRIDGGFNQHFDLFRFIRGLDDAVAATAADAKKFERLAKRLGRNDRLGKQELRDRLGADAARIHRIRSRYFRPSIEVGPGRMDALGLVHNQIVANDLGVPENRIALTAPVKWPFLWNVPQSAWIGWRGTQQLPLFRNVGESMVLWVAADLTSKTPATGLFESTVDLPGQIDLEKLLRRLAPPMWPEEVLGKIDQQQAARGAMVFAQHCAQCHSQWPHRWSDPRKRGKRFIENALIPAEVIGTDATQVENLRYGRNPIFKAARMSEFLPAPYKHRVLAPSLVIAGTAVQGVIDRAVAALKLTARELEDANGYRDESEPTPPNGLYKAAPSDGTWAAAPYLHNGSVPNLYELLIPARQRSRRFFLGREFDPVKVGVDTTGRSGKFLYDTTLMGNSNAGHSFEDGPQRNGVIGPLLTEGERWAVIEFLKSIPNKPAQVTPFGGPKNPTLAWEDKTFYHNQVTGGYQGRRTADFVK